MRAAAAAAASKAAGKEKSRRKGGGGGGEQLLTDQVLSLRARLHHALALGLAKSDGGPKKWQSTDAGMQSHVLKAASAFLGCLSNELLRLPPIKESISDILIALEVILQSMNVSVLIQATDVSLKLVSSVGNLARQYPVLEIVTCLASQLSASQITIAVSSASALYCILNTLATARVSIHAEIWQALEKTDAVTSVIGALQNYSPDVHPLNYLMEMMSLLRIILWIWPSSRYHVWSNRNLMGKLAQYCVASEMDVAVRVLKLYAALALCGNGAMVLLNNEDLMAKVGVLLGKSNPSIARIEALKFYQILLRSSKGCDLLMAPHYQHIIEGTINAMSRDDERLLTIEGCRTALLVLRYAGDHHRLFWSHAIDDVLYKILSGLLSICLTSTRRSLLIMGSRRNKTRERRSREKLKLMIKEGRWTSRQKAWTRQKEVFRTRHKSPRGSWELEGGSPIHVTLETSGPSSNSQLARGGVGVCERERSSMNSACIKRKRRRKKNSARNWMCAEA